VKMRGIKTINIHFIYGFHLMNVPPDLFVLLRSLIESEGEKDALPAVFRRYQLSTPYTTGFSAYLAINDPTIRLLACDEGKSDEVVIQDLHPSQSSAIHGVVGKLTRHLFLCANGIGSLTFDLSISPCGQAGSGNDGGMTLESVLELLLLGEKVDEAAKRRRYAIAEDGEHQGKTLPEMFEQEVDDVIGGLSALPGGKPPRAICWLERDGDEFIVRHGIVQKRPQEAAHDARATDGNYQNPFVLTEIETESVETYRELLDTKGAEDTLPDSLEYIILRIGSSGVGTWKLDKGYMARHGVNINTGAYRNFYPSEYLYINLHFRSSLIVYPQLQDDTVKPVAETIERFRSALHDTLSLLLARWQFLVITHAYVDELLEFFYESWCTHGISDDTVAVTEQMVSVRMTVARALESPLVFRCAASSLNELHRVGSHIFEIENLQRALVEKLSQFRMIVDDCLYAERLRDRMATRGPAKT